MPRVSPAHQAVVRRRIVDAAVRVFSAHGYRQATVADVVRESGLSVGAIYTYYDSKESLFLEACDLTAARGVEELARRLDGVTGTRERLAIAISLWVESVDTFDGAPGQVAMVGAWAEAERDPAVREMLGRRRERLVAAGSALIAEGVQRGDLPGWLVVDDVARAFISMLDGLVLQRLESGSDYAPGDAIRQARAIVEVLLASVCAPAGPVPHDDEHTRPASA